MSGKLDKFFMILFDGLPLSDARKKLIHLDCGIIKRKVALSQALLKVLPSLVEFWYPTRFAI